MEEGKKELLNQLSIIEELADNNICRMPDSMLMGIAVGIRAMISKEYVRGISREDVARYYGISTRTLERWQKDYHDFPQPRHQGTKSVSYDYAEVITWRKTHQELINKI